MKVFGFSMYWNPARWGTPDGTIPFSLFWVLLDQLEHVGAGDQLRMMQAVQHGYVAARNPNDSAVGRATRRLVETALPLVREAADETDDEM